MKPLVVSISSYASDLTQDTNWPVMFLTQFFDSLLFEESFASRLRISITFLNRHLPFLYEEVGAVNTDLKLSEITGLKMYFFTGLNAVLYVVPCNLSCDMIYQKF